MKEMLKNTKPQLLLILGMLLVAVLFSLFKAVSSLSGTAQSPDYDRTPPAAFADVPRITLYDSQGRKDKKDFEALAGGGEGLRLPDESYVLLLGESERLSEKIFSGRLEEGDLISAGMEPAEARSTVNELAVLAGEKVSEVNYSPLALQTTFVNSPGESGRLPVGLVQSIVEFNSSLSTGSLIYDFVNEKEDDWRLLSLQFA